MWDRFTKDLPIEIAKKRKYKVNMLNWVLDETKPGFQIGAHREISYPILKGTLRRCDFFKFFVFFSIFAIFKFFAKIEKIEIFEKIEN